MPANQPTSFRSIAPEAGMPSQEASHLHLIDLRAVVEIVWRGKWLILAMFLTCLCGVWVVVQKMTPLYTATAEVLLNIPTSNFAGLEELVARLPSDASRVESEVEVITSEQVLGRTIEELGLEEDPEFNASLRERSQFSEWMRMARAELSRLLGTEPDPAAFDPVLAAEAQRVGVMNALLGALEVTQVGLSRVITISATSLDPHKAARIADTVAEQYLVDQLEAKFEATRRASTWLSERIADLRKQVEESETAMEAFKASQTTAFGQGIDLTNEQLAAANEQLVTARAERTEAEARLTQVRQLLTDGGMTAVANALASPLIEALQTERGEVSRQIAELLTRYSEAHPSMIELRARQASVDQALAEEVMSAVESLANDAALAKAREITLAANLAAIESQSLEQSGAAVQLRQLEGEAAASRQIYEDFLNRFKERSEQATLMEADARIISAARPPIVPSEPNKPILAAIAGVFGLALGTGMVLLREFLADTYRTPEEVESEAGVPVLASLPAMKRRWQREGLRVSLANNPNSALAEGVRSLRTAIFVTPTARQPHTVMITSSLAGEGKSTLCILLAQMTVQMGRTAVIVDCDVRRPSLHRAFGLARSNVPDLIAVLEGAATLDEALQTAGDGGVAIVPIFRPAPHAADLLATGAFSQICAALRARFDVVLLDSPPLLTVSDAGVIGQHCDTAIYAIRWHQTSREAVAQGLKQLRAYEVPLAGAALTMVDPRRAARFSRSRYHYGYSRTRNPYHVG